MSTLAVKVENVVAVEPHPNADRLDLIQVLDWRCVTQKGTFKPGDKCVYFPVDSILPQDVEDLIFGPDSKVKLDKHRVKTIKLRGAISQGLAVDPLTLAPKYSGPIFLGQDLTFVLGVTKYEPPAPPANMSSQKGVSRKGNPNFKKYTDISNIKFYPNAFKPDEKVFVTEKIHGTNFRAGWVPTETNTIWKKILKFFRILPEYEFVFGSHRVQYQDKLIYRGFYSSNVYAEACEQYNLRDRLHYGEVVYGEIYGPGIQKGYAYGIKPGEGDSDHEMVIFDVMKDGKYLDADTFFSWASVRDFDTVPLLFVGTYSEWKAQHEDVELSSPSALDESQKVKEGFVVKPVRDRIDPMAGRLALKVINPEYLLKDQTDFH